MDRRERFRRTLARQSVDRPPFDLGCTPMSYLDNPAAEDQLRALLGISGPKDRRYMNLDEQLLRALDIDFRRAGGMLEPESPLARKASGGKYVNCWGIEYSWRGGCWQITGSPLADADEADLDAFPWPQAASADRAAISAWRDNAKRICEETDYVVCAEHPVLGVMELGCWMCGFDDFLYRMAGEPEFVLKFFDKVFQYQTDAIDLYYGALGPYIHVTTSGDDFGTQGGPFVSPNMFSELVAPYYDKRIALTRQYTGAAFFHHTCGSVFTLIPRLIEAGVDILNPIQPTAFQMEPERLKAAYGDKITFWGGIDTQEVLPRGSRARVAEHVREVLDVFGRDGGYVFAPAHVIQTDVPPENILAMYEAARAH